MNNVAKKGPAGGVPPRAEAGYSRPSSQARVRGPVCMVPLVSAARDPYENIGFGTPLPPIPMKK